MVTAQRMCPRFAASLALLLFAPMDGCDPAGQVDITHVLETASREDCREPGLVWKLTDRLG
jgi:hypothetical protein